MMDVKKEKYTYENAIKQLVASGKADEMLSSPKAKLLSTPAVTPTGDISPVWAEHLAKQKSLGMMAEKKYVEVDAFAEAICNFQHIDEDAANNMIWLLRTFPTADVVAVIRCKKCGNFCKNTGECNMYGHHPGEDGYCSGAIPKERES